MLRIESPRLFMYDATKEDIKLIMHMEQSHANNRFICMGSEEEHRKEVDEADYMLLLFREKSDDRVMGYALIRLDFKSNVFELRRIVITEKAKGYGREALKAIIRYAFSETNTNRFWLDVYTEHTVGIKLYESLGMKKDGVLRQSYLSDRGYLDQCIYSILREEYKEEDFI